MLVARVKLIHLGPRGDRRSQSAATGWVDLRRAFDEGDFLGCEVVEFIHEFINLLVGGGDGVLQHGLFRLRRANVERGLPATAIFLSLHR